MPNNHDDELAYIQAKFWLDKSPLKTSLLPYKAYQQTDHDWRRDIEEAHNDVLFYMQKLRPFFMRGDGRGPIRPPEPTLVALSPEPEGDGPSEPTEAPEAPSDPITNQTTNDPFAWTTDVPSAWTRSYYPDHLRARNTITLAQSGVYVVHWDFADRMELLEDMHFERILVSDAGEILPHGPIPSLKWSSARLLLPDGEPVVTPFHFHRGKHVSYSNFGHKKGIKAESLWGSLTLCFFYTATDTRPRTFHFDATFSHPRKETHPTLTPVDWDALTVECPKCGAKPGDLCLTENGIIQQNRTHRPRRRLVLSSDQPEGPVRHSAAE